MSVSGTTAVRRQLGRRLKSLREAAGITVEQVIRARLGSEATIWRIERGKVAVKVPTVRALADFYGADKETRTQLEDLADGTAGHGWWQEYADLLPEWFKLYVDLELEASAIRSWDGSLVTGILQTPEYATALFRGWFNGDGEMSIERRVQMRMARAKRVLTRNPAPTITAVIEEGALTRHVGGPAVMAAQLAYLRELGERPNIEVLVLPFAAGPHPGMSGAFTLLDFDHDDDPSIAYVETLVGGRYLERQEELSRYRATWEVIRERSVPIGEYQ